MKKVEPKIQNGGFTMKRCGLRQNEHGGYQDSEGYQDVMFVVSPHSGQNYYT